MRLNPYRAKLLRTVGGHVNLMGLVWGWFIAVMEMRWGRSKDVPSKKRKKKERAVETSRRFWRRKMAGQNRKRRGGVIKSANK